MKTDDIQSLQTKRGFISYYKNDLWMMKALRHGEFHEQALILEYLKPYIETARVAIDGGAHAGSHSILYKALNPKLVIHAFEPQSRLFRLLDYNIAQNKLHDVYLYNYALANAREVLTLSNEVIDDDAIYRVTYGGSEPTNLGGVGLGQGGEKVECVTIDSLELEVCDFIKLDVEGAEPLALLGALETLQRCKPVVVFEYNSKELSDDIRAVFGVPKYTSADILIRCGYQEPIRLGDSENFLALPEKENA